MAYDDDISNGTTIMTVHVPISGGDTIPDECNDQLIAIGAKLHAIFLSPEGTSASTPGIPKSGLASPEELMEMARQERCPLFSFICALGTGDTDTRKHATERGEAWESDLYCPYVAT
eukprot:scaffold37816_cov40-Attheya_sp.AAC.1